MRYYVEVTDNAKKEIRKLDRSVQVNIKNKINELQNNPFKGKHILGNFYELKAKNFRVYYEVFRGIIVVEKVEYEGKVKLHGVGTKDCQRRDIKKYGSH